MLGFLKIFLQGILYVVTLPIILLVLAIYAAYCIIVFIYMAIRSIIVFFMGGSPLGDLPEDVEAKRILMEREEAKKANSVQSFADALAQSQAQLVQNIYSQQNQQVNKPEEQNDFSVPEFESSDDDYEENKIEDYDDGQSY